MIIPVVKAVSGALIGLSVLSLGGPVIGEMIATMAPPFTSRARQAVENLGIPYEPVSFETSEALILRGWFFPAEDTQAPAVLYAPATSHDQRSGLSLVKPLHAAGFHVLLFSYRGHAESDGDRFGFTYGAKESQDVDAAVRYLSEKRGVKRIAAIGHSAGAVSALLSAARSPQIGAVVAISPFLSVETVWQTNRPSFILPGFYDFLMKLSELRKGFSRQQVQPVDVVGKIAPRPVLIIHGAEDKRISIQQARRLYQAAEAPKTFWLVQGATHASVRSPGLELLMDRVIEFLQGALSTPQFAASN